MSLKGEERSGPYEASEGIYPDLGQGKTGEGKLNLKLPLCSFICKMRKDKGMR
jgi:hypothetical protein